MSNTTFRPFTGSSRTVVEGEQAGAQDDMSLLQSLFSDKSREEFAKECKLGMYTNLSSNNRLNYIDLVPKNTGSRALNLFKSEYEKGHIPSSGVLSIPRVLVFLVRTTTVTESGSVTIRLVDLISASSVEILEPVDGTQEATIPISSLPAIVCFSPSYDCPMQMIGNRHRCFGLVTQLDGVISSGSTVVMSHAYWSANFRSKPNNYKQYAPMYKYVEPFDRLKRLSRKQLKNYVRGITNQSVNHGYLLGKPLLKTDEQDPEMIVLEEESLTPTDSNGVGKDKIAVTAKSVAGLPTASLSINRR
ncbi:movement protein [Cowpea chlorotic mottle virus]|uniref:Movement protein n=2 Tax=Cowpea chlorotic mottle virus TaxID=12303 RepID=MVP_CCMV|nr:movement protein [Cowpea chlorotic mottle virus]P20180.1 RecName: Full=Movement protein; Short=MP; AltName: Full=Protein 3A [Cowpea chlorotic mottle virus]AAA46372.1 3a protein [Cowpea chlorotic mottle virus]AAN37633.1 3a protein [Cowpea chlorotic mottle virus]AAN37637.1 3a protein [Cowpea chlorotic mottle virus]